MRVVSGRAGRELGHVQPAKMQRALGAQPGERCGGVIGSKVAADFRAASRHHTLAVVHVLVGERNAVQQADRSSRGHFRISGVSRVQRTLWIERDEAVEFRSDSFDARNARFGHLARTGLFAVHCRGHVDQAHVGQ